MHHTVPVRSCKIVLRTAEHWQLRSFIEFTQTHGRASSQPRESGQVMEDVRQTLRCSRSWEGKSSLFKEIIAPCAGDTAELTCRWPGLAVPKVGHCRRRSW